MSVKLALFLLLIFPIGSLAVDSSSRANPTIAERGNRIDLDGNDALAVPMSLSESAGQTHLFDRLPIYSVNRSINGTFSPFHDGISLSADKDSKFSVCVSPFNISEYLSDSPENYFAGIDCMETLSAERTAGSNDTNAASFKISKKPAGMYTISVFDENGSTLLSKQPFLVTEGDIVLKMESQVASSEPFIRIKMNTSAFENQSKFFATLMIPREDYENVSLSLAENRTTGRADINLALGQKSLQIYGPLSISSDLLMSLLPLLPQGSAVGLQESSQSGVELTLMADQPWKKGKYVLTCGIYSPDKGMIGVKQANVEVV